MMGATEQEEGGTKMKVRLGRGITVAVLAWVFCMAIRAFAQEGTPAPQPQGDPMEQDVTQGALRIKTEGGIVECPLKHTDVKAVISGFIARVTVTQTFFNPLDEKIEAVYVFPLPHEAAVDDMTMVIGDRRIVGLIKRRDVARQIYEQALAQGMTAALLEQERPNIFTQSVGNIGPKQEVNIEISYVDVLKYDMGTYEFYFPMVVGPRYIPGGATSKIAPVPDELKGKVGELDKTKVVEGPDNPKGNGWAPDTNRVPDASRITPPVLKPGYRNGHDISLSVDLDAGVPIQDLKSTNHEVKMEKTGNSRAAISISEADSIPNKDFTLRYGVVGEKPEMAMLCHTDDSFSGYFMLMIQPKEDERLKQSPPREICFLIDVSGSMSGEPTAKIVDAMSRFLKLCKPNDTVQVITFESDSRKLFDQAVPVTPDNISKALNFTSGLRGSGGTEMLKGIKMAMNDKLDPERVRIVMLMSDGFIGNESEIIAEVGRNAGDQIRFWCIGIGSSPNQFLLDGVAKQGGGMSKVLGLKDDAEPLVQEVMFRIHRAQLANVQINWGDASIYDVLPAKTPELWAGRPVVVFGRYDRGGLETVVTVSGKVEGQPTAWPVKVFFPEKEPANDVLAKVWARKKIEDLMQQTYYQGSPEVEEEVTQIALDYRLMSQYTSFVAVDQKDLNQLTEPPKPPRRMLVPVPIPEGTRYEGFFGPSGGDMERGAFDDGRMYKFATGASVALPQEKAKNEAKDAGRPGGMSRRPRPKAPMQAGGGPGRTLGNAVASQPAKPQGTHAAPPTTAPAPMLAETEEAAEPGYYGGGDGYSVQALMQKSAGTVKQAEEALKLADELKKKGELQAAREMCAWVYLLDCAAMTEGQSDGTRAGNALSAIEDINKELVKTWAKDLPALDKKLDIVIRDRSLAEALDDVARAGGVKVNLLPGSVEDACAALFCKELRVTYLDLKRATVAQALDWILLPVKMTWSVDKGEVFAGTARRSVQVSAWVYDVSHIAIPAKAEYSGKNWDENVKAAAKAMDQFFGAVKDVPGLGEKNVAWYSAGMIAVFADAQTHEKVSNLFTGLADAKADVGKGLAGLQKVTSKRAEGSAEALDKLIAANGRRETYDALETQSWKLLSAAAQGRLDVEALTYLRVALRSGDMAGLLGKPKDAKFDKFSLDGYARLFAEKERDANLLRGPGALAAVRTLWILSEAANALPQEAELAELAKGARNFLAAASRTAIDGLAQATPGAQDFEKVLYCALGSGDAKVTADAKAAITARNFERTVFKGTQALATALLGTSDDTVRKSLADAFLSWNTNAQFGADWIVITALSCRKAGGSAWDTFRINSAELLGKQALPGSVVVLVNHLSRSKLPIVDSVK